MFINIISLLILFFFTPAYNMNQIKPFTEPLSPTIIARNWQKQIKQIPPITIDRTLEEYKKVEIRIPYDTSILRKETQRKYNLLLDDLHNIALYSSYKSEEAQDLITKRFIEQCTPFPYYSDKYKAEYYTSACTLFNFFLTLSHNKKEFSFSQTTKDLLIKLIDSIHTVDPNSGIITVLRACRYVQAHTQQAKDITYALLMDKSTNKDIVCHYLISKVDAHTFITNIIVADDIVQTKKKLDHYAQIAIGDHIITALKKDAKNLTSDCPFSDDINFCIAYLSQQLGNNTQADEFYTKIMQSQQQYAKDADTVADAFNARINVIKNISPDDITYLTTYFQPFHKYAAAREKTPTISSIIAAVFDNIMQQKTDNPLVALETALEHAHYALNNKTLSQKKREELYALCAHCHTQLVHIHENNNKKSLALSHFLQALENTIKTTANDLTQELIDSLTTYKENNADMYDEHAPLLLFCLQLIYDTKTRKYNADDNKKYDLAQFVSLDISNAIIKSLEAKVQENGPNKEAILYLLMCMYEYKKDTHNTLRCIKNMATPLPFHLVIKKLKLVIAQDTRSKDNFTHDDISKEDITILITNFLKDKKSSKEMLNIIEKCMNDIAAYCIDSRNYQLAQTIAQKMITIPSLQHCSIGITYLIEYHLNDINDPYQQQWETFITSDAYYKKIQECDLSKHNEITNFYAGSLLICKKTQFPYEKIVMHFTKALQDTQMPDETRKEINKQCGILYHAQAEIKKSNEKEYLRLLDCAIKHEDYFAQLIKALYLIDKATKNAVHQGTLLLEDLDQKIKNKQIHDKDLIGVIYLRLGYLSCNYFFDVLKNKKIAPHAPYNMEKAIEYIEKSAECNNTDAQQFLAKLYSEMVQMPAGMENTYGNTNKALHYLSIVSQLPINDDDQFINLLSLCYIHEQLGQFDKEIEFFDAILSNKNFYKKYKQELNEILWKKGLKLIEAYPDNATAFNNGIQCTKTALDEFILDAFHEKTYVHTVGNNTIANIIPLLIKKKAQIYIHNKDMSQEAVNCCCVAAALISGILIISNTYDKKDALHNFDIRPIATEEENDIVHYLEEASHLNNLDAQIMGVYFFDRLGPTRKGYPKKELLCIYQALHNKDCLEKKEITASLINYLKILSRGGIPLAHFILCDYYKNDTKKLEEIIVLFRKLVIIGGYSNHYLASAAINDFVQTIYKSCKKTFDVYRDHYLKAIDLNYVNGKKKLSFAENLIVMTSALMQRHFHTREDLCEAAGLLNMLKPQLPLYDNFIMVTLGSIYFDLASLTDDEKKRYIFLRDSSFSGWTPAAVKLADIWLTNEPDNRMPITLFDFIPTLKAAIDKDSSNKELNDLLTTCLYEEAKRSMPSLINNEQKEYNTLPKDVPYNVNLTPAESIIINTYAQKNGKKSQGKKASNQKIQTIQKIYNNDETLLEKAINHTKDPYQMLAVALLYLEGKELPQNYIKSALYLNGGLINGMVKDTSSAKQKYILTSLNLDRLTIYIESLVKGNHPTEIKKIILQKIKAILMKNDFIKEIEEVILHEYGIILSSLPEWKS